MIKWVQHPNPATLFSEWAFVVKKSHWPALGIQFREYTKNKQKYMGIDVPGFNLPRTQTSSAKYAKQTAQQYQYRCADLTASQADQLYASGHTYLDADGDGDACEPDARREYTPRVTTSSSGGNCHWVDGYTRKNGSYVKGHRRCK